MDAARVRRIPIRSGSVVHLSGLLVSPLSPSWFEPYLRFCLRSEVGRLLITLVALARDRTQLSQLRLKQSSQDDVLLYLGFMVPAALRQFNNLLVLGALNYGTPAVLQAFLVSKVRCLCATNNLPVLSISDSLPLYSYHSLPSCNTSSSNINVVYMRGSRSPPLS